MTQEERIDRLEAKTSELDRKVDLIAAKVDATLEGLNDFKAEMRQQNEMRANEIRSLGEKIENIGAHVRNLSITAMIGIGAMVLTVVFFVNGTTSRDIPQQIPAQPPAQTTTLKVIPK